MGVFSPQGITDVGRMLLLKIQSGAAIFDATKLVIGSGSMPTGATVASMTAVVTPVKELNITKKKQTNDGKAIFGGVYTNIDITSAFYFREFALYARPMYVAEDGSTTYGDEVLYVYGNAGETADLMPAYSTSTVIEKELDMIVWVGNEATVNLEIAGGVYITRAEVEELILEITPESIGAVRATDGYLEAKKSGVARTVRMTKHSNAADEADIANYGDSNNYQGIRIGKENSTLADALKLARMVGGAWSAFRIYHEGNKPTPSAIGAPSIIDGKSANVDMDAILKSGTHFAFYDTNSLTLGTPFNKGASPSTAATILSYAIDANYGSQMAFTAGGDIYIRTLSNGNISAWVSLYHQGNITAGTTDIAAGTSALADGSYYFVYE